MFKYKNLFMAELEALYDRKYIEVMKISDHLWYNEQEQGNNFPYQKKNQVNEIEFIKFQEIFINLLS